MRGAAAVAHIRVAPATPAASVEYRLSSAWGRRRSRGYRVRPGPVPPQVGAPAGKAPPRARLDLSSSPMPLPVLQPLPPRCIRPPAQSGGACHRDRNRLRNAADGMDSQECVFRPDVGSKLQIPRRPIVDFPARRHHSSARAAMLQAAFLFGAGAAFQQSCSAPELLIAGTVRRSKRYNPPKLEVQLRLLLVSNLDFVHTPRSVSFAVVLCPGFLEVGRSAVFREAYALGQTAVFRRTCERKNIMLLEP